jgi:hypothetical protein
MDATALLRRLLRAARGRRRPAPRPAPAATVCERCGMLVDTACWHRHCPLTGERHAR